MTENTDVVNRLVKLSEINLLKLDDTTNKEIFTIGSEYQNLSPGDKLEMLSYLLKWCSQEIKDILI